ncbi:MAG TPA: hypothetical protein VGR08_01410 [Thermomicrobiales bacterium]|nr:hypothetical protein [Thermomicrobiales bacterium]
MPVRPPPRARRPSTRSAVVGGLLLLALTGCAEGTSRDAQRAREDDAERTSVVDALQATTSAGLVRRGAEVTPPPTEAAPTEEAEGN